MAEMGYPSKIIHSPWNHPANFMGKQEISMHKSKPWYGSATKFLVSITTKYSTKMIHKQFCDYINAIFQKFTSIFIVKSASAEALFGSNCLKLKTIVFLHGFQKWHINKDLFFMLSSLESENGASGNLLQKIIHQNGEIPSLWWRDWVTIQYQRFLNPRYCASPVIKF